MKQNFKDNYDKIKLLSLIFIKFCKRNEKTNNRIKQALLLKQINKSAIEEVEIKNKDTAYRLKK